MVAFSRFSFTLAVTGLACAQSFDGERQSNLSSGMPPVGPGMPTGAYPSGATQPSGRMSGHGHRGPRLSGVAGPSGAAQAQFESSAPFDAGMPSDFPSGIPRPTGGMHGRHGHSSEFSMPTGGFPSETPPSGMPSGNPSAEMPTGAFLAIPTGLDKRQDSGMLSGMPSGAMPPKGARPTGARPSGPMPSGKPSAMLSGPAPLGTPPSSVEKRQASEMPTGFPSDIPFGLPSGAMPPNGARPTGMPSGDISTPGPLPTGARPSGRPSGAFPFSVRPTGTQRRQASASFSGMFSGAPEMPSGAARSGSVPSGAMPPHGARPSGAMPSGDSRGGPHGGPALSEMSRGPHPTGMSSGPMPSGIAPNGFSTSTLRS
ncbi:hypothetical protein TW65_05528 [Stemphylium lycopersici]|nr:hypothetical protein TW65_05528 [Stemphylium lycopersici]